MSKIVMSTFCSYCILHNSLLWKTVEKCVLYSLICFSTWPHLFTTFPMPLCTPYIKLHVVGTRTKYCSWKALWFLLQNDVWGERSVFVPPALINAVEDHFHNLHTVSVAFPTNWYITMSLTGINPVLKKKKKERGKKTPTKNIKLRGGNLTPLFNSEAFWETVYVE